MTETETMFSYRILNNKSEKCTLEIWKAQVRLFSCHLKWRQNDVILWPIPPKVERNFLKYWHRWRRHFKLINSSFGTIVGKWSGKDMQALEFRYLPATSQFSSSTKSTPKYSKGVTSVFFLFRLFFLKYDTCKQVIQGVFSVFQFFNLDPFEIPFYRG